MVGVELAAATLLSGSRRGLKPEMDNRLVASIESN
jgi:hypothetical protein